ncbi:hypothetical protein PMAYCL1PPCAC_19446, partial [Pristionchus mayeri]
TYKSIFADISSMNWMYEKRMREYADIGQLADEEKPFCVFTCSDVFLDSKCDEKPSCSQANFTGELTGEKKDHYISVLK